MDSKNPNVGAGMVGAPACGDVVKLQIQVKDGHIEQVAFKTFGYGSSIASASYVIELLKGKSLEDAEKIRNTKFISVEVS